MENNGKKADCSLKIFPDSNQLNLSNLYFAPITWYLLDFENILPNKTERKRKLFFISSSLYHNIWAISKGLLAGSSKNPVMNFDLAHDNCSTTFFYVKIVSAPYCVANVKGCHHGSNYQNNECAADMDRSNEIFPAENEEEEN
ncbi:hypothetical protein T07_5568 [Trichinella nelsoni]|uniref:Uncharacterized protein n=1 Tax=Trichinella nelsoni TaxID=6336 RepID=A0A0V0SN86_9BILA|nr:hypothetical protein T07_5568 [Trichinella nelsoni]